MLLTLTTTHQPATDLGYLLHKNPASVHHRDLSYGKAHVVWPEASEQRATAALILEIDPVSLVRGRPDAHTSGPLAQYVNDRPYVASSLLASAISRVFGSALNGRSKDRPELVDTAIPLELRLPTLPCRGGEPFLRRLFEPLGYSLIARRLPRDETVPEWGESAIYDVTLTATITVQQALRHLYVLIPVLDDDKHYWVGRDEVDKLVSKGEDWLADHPERESIALRSLARRRSLANAALSQLVDADEVEASEAGSSTPEEALERPLSLNQVRLSTVLDKLVELGVSEVADLGCGEGKLLRMLLKRKRFHRVLGMDVSASCLEKAERRLGLDRMPASQAERLTLIQGSLTWRDKRLDNLEAACLVEVIEHIDAERLPAVQHSLFGGSQPRHVIITTPNSEYNALFKDLPAGRMRHGDHRFEWTRAEFEAWTQQICATWPYEVTLHPVGELHAEHGAPTQMAVFTRCS